MTSSSPTTAGRSRSPASWAAPAPRSPRPPPRVLLESACFDPASVARTARRLGLPSEASRRFERGVDPELAPYARRGRGADAGRARRSDRRAGRHRRRRGVAADAPPGAAPARRVASGSIGRAVSGRGPAAPARAARLPRRGGRRPALRVTPPSWRSDLERPADLVEEIARLEGYETIPVTLPRAPAGRGLTDGPARPPPDRRRARRRRFRRGPAAAVPGRRRRRPARAARGRRRAGARRASRTRCPRTSASCAPRCCPACSPPPPATSAAATPTSRWPRSAPSSGPGPAPMLTPPVPGVSGRPPTPEQLAALDAALPDQPRHVARGARRQREPAGLVGRRARRRLGRRGRDGSLARPHRRRAADRRAPPQVAPWHPGSMRGAGRRATPDGAESVVGHAGELHPRVVAEWELPARAVRLRAGPRRACSRPPARSVEVPPVSPYPPADRDVALVVPAGVPRRRGDRSAAGRCRSAARDGRVCSTSTTRSARASGRSPSGCGGGRPTARSPPRRSTASATPRSPRRPSAPGRGCAADRSGLPCGSIHFFYRIDCDSRSAVPCAFFADRVCRCGIAPGEMFARQPMPVRLSKSCPLRYRSREEHLRPRDASAVSRRGAAGAGRCSPTRPLPPRPAAAAAGRAGPSPAGPGRVAPGAAAAPAPGRSPAGSGTT